MPNNQPPAGNDAIVTERNRYFTGKYMTARDFLSEQEYFLNRHRLHNRLLHGWGIVCGLEVEYHNDPNCAAEWVVVQPGIALDSHGRELIVHYPLPVKLPEPDNLQSTEAKSDIEEAEDTSATQLLFCLRYHEELIELVPALYDESGSNTKHEEANRVRETVVAEFKSFDDVDPSCWLSPSEHHDEEPHCHNDCDGRTDGSGSCLDIDAPCGDSVPLALITLDNTYKNGFKLENKHGRRNILGSREVLTQITRINWPHGGTITLEEFKGKIEDPETKKHRFTVYFDRKLLSPESGTAHGINENTFTIQFVNADDDLEYLRHVDIGVDSINENVAYFEIEEGYLKTGRGSIANSTLKITLKCDFILDCHGKPVDGNHLCGRLPSGNGTPGGTFESWLEITS